jgi:hypothetical protein
MLASLSYCQNQSRDTDGLSQLISALKCSPEVFKARSVRSALKRAGDPRQADAEPADSRGPRRARNSMVRMASAVAIMPLSGLSACGS